MKLDLVLIISKEEYSYLIKILNGEHDFAPINPVDDGYFFHISTLKKFLNETLEFDELPTYEELEEIEQIVNKMIEDNANFLYLV